MSTNPENIFEIEVKLTEIWTFFPATSFHFLRYCYDVINEAQGRYMKKQGCDVNFWAPEA